MWKKLVDYYNNNSTFHGAVAAAEGGLYTGLATCLAMGLPLNKQSLVALGGAIAGGIATALRNYFKDRLNQPAVVAGEKQLLPDPEHK